jgi:hypothetical protein
VEVFEMKKDTQINLRVRREQLNKIKELGFKNIDCWEIGYERICESERAELEKMVKKYYDLYIHVNTRLENFGKKSDSENAELDRLLIWYRKADRSLTEPTGADLDALRYQLKKKEIHTFTVDQVLEYWRSKQEGK